MHALPALAPSPTAPQAAGSMWRGELYPHRLPSYPSASCNALYASATQSVGDGMATEAADCMSALTSLAAVAARPPKGEVVGRSSAIANVSDIEEVAFSAYDRCAAHRRRGLYVTDITAAEWCQVTGVRLSCIKHAY